MDLHVSIRDEGDSYWAGVDELPGCFASGDTLPELMAGLGEAITLYLAPAPSKTSDGDSSR